MTDAIDGGAAAPAEATPAPEVEAVSTPNPIETAPQPAPEPKAEKPASIDDAIDRATAKVEKEAKAEKPVEKAEPEKIEAKPEAKRDETGKFASDKPKAEAEKTVETVEAKPATEQPAKTPSPHGEAPTRFSNDAKAAWETAPEPIKAEVHRAIRELEQGHQKYKADSEAYDQVRQFDQIARQNGGNLKASLDRVVEIENAFSRNPIDGFQKVADHFGLSLRAVAAHIMGQTPEQVQGQHESTIASLKNELAALKQQVGTVTQSFEQQRTTATLGQVEAFAKDHPRFDEISEDIAFFLNSGRTKDLSEAYALAERLNPAPVQTSTTPATPAIDLVAQTDKGSKSITGAPSSGSNPAVKKPSKSLDESLDRAFARAG